MRRGRALPPLFKNFPVDFTLPLGGGGLGGVTAETDLIALTLKGLFTPAHSAADRSKGGLGGVKGVFTPVTPAHSGNRAK